MLLVSGNFEKEIKDLVKNASSYSNGTSLDVLHFQSIFLTTILNTFAFPINPLQALKSL